MRGAGGDEATPQPRSELAHELLPQRTRNLTVPANVHIATHLPRATDMTDRQYYLYIMANRHNTVLYTGVSNDLLRRVCEHRQGLGGGFSSYYRTNKLVYYEVYEDPESANHREMQLKAGSRRKKEALVASVNPGWQDLYAEIAEE